MNEYYVTYKVAKLLKEKGFDWECLARYDKPILSNNVSIFTEENAIDWNTYYYGSDYKCSAPTQQMDCHWLRETYGLWVVPMPCLEGGCYFEIYKRYGKIWKNNVYDHIDYENFDKPEDAIEAALEYALKNLI